MSSTTATRALGEALRKWFDLKRDEALVAEGSTEVRLPSLPLVKGRLAALARAWGACPEAEAVYRTTAAAWRERWGRCPLNGQRLPCSCSAPRTESGAA